jgi:hypothetical protein
MVLVGELYLLFLGEKVRKTLMDKKKRRKNIVVVNITVL